MADRGFYTSQWARNRAKGRTWDQAEPLTVYHSDLLPLARPHILKFPELPKTVLLARDQTLSSEACWEHSPLKPQQIGRWRDGSELKDERPPEVEWEEEGKVGHSRTRETAWGVGACGAASSECGAMEGRVVGGEQDPPRV